jgi:hypothetical protein
MVDTDEQPNQMMKPPQGLAGMRPLHASMSTFQCAPIDARYADTDPSA